MEHELARVENIVETARNTPVDDHVESYSGRPPWFDTTGKLKQPYVVGLCGGSASGKTTVANNIIKRLNVPWVVILSLDSFYNVLSQEEHEAADRMEYDFDSPSTFWSLQGAIDHELAVETLRKMKEGKTVRLMDFKIFVDTDSDLRLGRRHINPLASLADIVIPWSKISTRQTTITILLSTWSVD